MSRELRNQMALPGAGYLQLLARLEILLGRYIVPGYQLLRRYVKPSRDTPQGVATANDVLYGLARKASTSGGNTLGSQGLWPCLSWQYQGFTGPNRMVAQAIEGHQLRHSSIVAPGDSGQGFTPGDPMRHVRFLLGEPCNNGQ